MAGFYISRVLKRIRHFRNITIPYPHMAVANAIIFQNVKLFNF